MMIDFGALPEDDARARCAAYAAAAPGAVAWLEQEAARTGGPVPLGGADGLSALWEWAQRRLAETTDRFEGRGAPAWWSPDRTHPYLTDGALRLVDALGCHLAALAAERVPGARWEVLVSPLGPRDADHHRTVLAGLPCGRHADPARMVYGEAIGQAAHGEPPDPEALGRVLAAMARPRS